MNHKILISRIANTIADLFLPRGDCRVCGKVCKSGPVPGICRACFKKRKRSDENVCRICADRLPDVAVSDVCGRCLTARPTYEKHFNRYQYDGAIRELVLFFKAEKRYPLAGLMGRSIAREVTKKGRGTHFDYVTFIPSPMKRKISRRFCPAELIAQAVSKDLGAPMRSFLRIAKNVNIQKGLNARERRENIKNAFCSSKTFSSEERILLVDDVFTTGSTLEEASRTLSKNGARVYTATFAMVWTIVEKTARQGEEVEKMEEMRSQDR